LSADFGLKDGQTYIIGRRGHIRLSSPLVSKAHASIIIKNEKIYLRDLNSKNGTYLVNNNSLVNFEEGYVTPEQPIVIGNVRCTIFRLLKRISVNSVVKSRSSLLDDTTQNLVPTTSSPDNASLQN
jgi:pSer/pThr/pTyr-binding forkhead associated (FHA) protein